MLVEEFGMSPRRRRLPLPVPAEDHSDVNHGDHEGALSEGSVSEPAPLYVMYSPLYHAVSNSHIEVVEYLLSVGAGEDLHHKETCDPLILTKACAEGRSH